MLTRAQRKIERESKKIDSQEAKCLKEIKKMAMAGQHDAAKILSKDVVRMKTQKKQYMMMSSQLKSMTLQLQSMETQKAIMGALAGSNQVMAKINEDMDVAGIRDVLKEFGKQMGKTEMIGEMTNDAFEMMEDPSMQQEAGDVYDSILGEMNLAYVAGQPAVPIGDIKKSPAEEVKEDATDDLDARLAALRS